MSEKYSENLVAKEIARCIGDYFSKASLRLPFCKGYKGVVKSGSDNTYYVEVDGVEHKIRTDAALTSGEYVTLLSLQNQKGDYTLLPSVATSAELDEMLTSVLG